MGVAFEVVGLEAKLRDLAQKDDPPENATMLPREKSLEFLIDLFDHPTASRAEVLEKALACALKLADAEAVAALVVHNRALERWTLLREGGSAETAHVGRPGSEFGRMLLKSAHPIQLVDVSADSRVAAEDSCPGIEPGPALFVPLRHRQQAGGYLAVYRGRGLPRFTPEQVRLLTFLGAWL